MGNAVLGPRAAAAHAADGAGGGRRRRRGRRRGSFAFALLVGAHGSRARVRIALVLARRVVAGPAVADGRGVPRGDPTVVALRLHGAVVAALVEDLDGELDGRAAVVAAPGVCDAGERGEEDGEQQEAGAARGRGHRGEVWGRRERPADVGIGCGYSGTRTGAAAVPATWKSGSACRSWHLDSRGWT